mmetsp:Transcript_12526/g.12317  ORF Transcript_12526/g.12317 Transcript_12526/m.12317 type:complete len:107 (+) Transcript_12526:397-717(+)
MSHDEELYKHYQFITLGREEKYLSQFSYHSSEKTNYTSSQYYLEIKFEHKGLLKKKELVKPMRFMFGVNPPRVREFDDLHKEERAKFFVHQDQSVLPKQSSYAMPQ